MINADCPKCWLLTDSECLKPAHPGAVFLPTESRYDNHSLLLNGVQASLLIQKRLIRNAPQLYDKTKTIVKL